MIIFLIATIFPCCSSGQALNATQTQALEKLDPNAPLIERILVQHRRLLGVAIPFVFYQVLWWSCFIKYDFKSLFGDRYFISITMIFGSMIAGKENTFSGSPLCTFKTEPSKKKNPHDCFTAQDSSFYSVELLTAEREREEAISGFEKNSRS